MRACVNQSFVYLNVFVRSRLSRAARTVYVNTQFVLCNTTSLVLLIRQRGSSDLVTLGPKDRRPFSWHPGAGKRQIEVRVGNGPWSEGLPIGLKSGVSSLRMELDGLGVAYELLMEIRAPDEFSRVVVFSTRLHFANQTRHRLVVRAGLHHALHHILEPHMQIDSPFHAPRLHISALPPSSGAVPIYSFEPFALRDDTTVSLQIRSQTSPSHSKTSAAPDLSIDVTVKVEETGT